MPTITNSCHRKIIIHHPSSITTDFPLAPNPNPLTSKHKSSPSPPSSPASTASAAAGAHKQSPSQTPSPHPTAGPQSSSWGVPADATVPTRSGGCDRGDHDGGIRRSRRGGGHLPVRRISSIPFPSGEKKKEKWGGREEREDDDGKESILT